MSSSSPDRNHSPPPRNPSPPPVDQGHDEEVLKGDLIPGTAYSKQWLFSTFLKLLKKVEGLHPESADGVKECGGSGTSPKTGTTSSAKEDKQKTPEHQSGDEGCGSTLPSASPSAHRSPLTDQKLNDLIPPGYEILDPPSPIRPGEKIDEETEGELCQVRLKVMQCFTDPLVCLSLVFCFYLIHLCVNRRLLGKREAKNCF